MADDGEMAGNVQLDLTCVRFFVKGDLAQARICAAALQGFLEAVHDVKDVFVQAELSGQSPFRKCIVLYSDSDTSIPLPLIGVALEFIEGSFSKEEDNDDKPAG